jgi:hypothetical protein
MWNTTDNCNQKQQFLNSMKFLIPATIITQWEPEKYLFTIIFSCNETSENS